MKKIHSIRFILVVFIITFSSVSMAAEKNVDAQILGVRQYMKHFKQFSSQTVQIEGVVSKIYQGRHIIGIIDTTEFKTCKVVTCSELTLPIRWSGEMPHMNNRVSVIGKAKKENNGFIFIAEKLTIE